MSRYRLILQALLIINPALAAAQAPDMLWPGSRTGEFVIDTNVITIPDYYDERHPSIAFDGTNYFVVWENQTWNYGNEDIYGTRVTPSGIILDPSGIAIKIGGYGDYTPSVAFDGTNYLVVWRDNRNSANPKDIYGTRVSPEGIVLDSLNIAISISDQQQMYPEVAFVDSLYLVVWQKEVNYSWDIYGARVTQNGVVLDPGGIVISNAIENQEYPTINTDGTKYFVVWQDHRNGSADIYGTRVDPTGNVLDPAGILISTAYTHQKYPSVAFDGTNYLVVWQEEWVSLYDIYGARVNQTGVVIDTLGISISTALNQQQRPSVCFNGADYLAVWQDTRDRQSNIYGARVSSSGIVIDTSGLPITTAPDYQINSSILSDGEHCLVSWQDERNIDYSDIYCTRVNQFGIVLDTANILVSGRANSQEAPSVAYDGTNYFAVWSDNRNGIYDPQTSSIYGTRINPHGSLLDSMMLLISSAQGCHVTPSIAFGGTNYLVAWKQTGVNGGIRLKRVNTSGNLLDSLEIQFYGGWNPDVAFDGENYLVAWDNWENIFGARIDQSGNIIGDVFISVAPEEERTPAIAFGDTCYLVVWFKRTEPFWSIVGTRVNSLGNVLDTAGIVISTQSGCYYYPAVAFDGTNFLVVWVLDDGSICCTRVDQTGEVLDSPIYISTSTGARNPAVIFDGSEYLVVWHTSDICGAHVDTTGTVHHLFPVAAQEGDQITPAAAKGNDNQILITYSGWADSVYQHSANEMRIWGKFYPFVGIEETDPERPKLAYNLQSCPNPFSSGVDITWQIPEGIGGGQKSEVGISIYDVAGRLIRGFYPLTPNALHPAHVFWDGKDDSGNPVSAGVYFVKLTTDEYRTTRKVLLIK
jgi:hypothetical protein